MLHAVQRVLVLAILLPLTVLAEDWSVSYKFEPSIIAGFPPTGDWNNTEKWQPTICMQRDITGTCTQLGYPGSGTPFDAMETVFWQVTLANSEPFGPATMNMSVPVSPVGSLSIGDDVVLNVNSILGMNQQSLDSETMTWRWEQAKITNAGVLNNSSTINSNGGDLLLTGSGRLVMQGGLIEVPDNPVLANDPGLVSRSDIEGFGTIRASAGFHNEGMVDANFATGVLLVNHYQPPSRPGSNSGTLRASSGGTLRLQGSSALTPLDNESGTIEALDGSKVELRSLLIKDGVLSTAGTGVIEVQTYDNVGLADVTNNGLLQVASGQKLRLEVGDTGEITNNGTIRLATSGFVNTLLAPAGGSSVVRLAGNGQLQLTHATRTSVEGGGHLINGTDHTIEGAGRVWNNRFVTNEGLMDANISGERLRVQPQIAGQLFNQGLMRASNGGILEISAIDYSNFSNVDGTGGVIQAADGSLVEIRFVKVLGGTFATTGSGVVRTTSGGGVELEGVTNLGRLDLQSGTILNAGTLTNNGLMTLGNGSSGQSLSIAVNGTTTLAGGGSMVLSNSAANQITSAGGLATTLVNGSGHTLRGSGGIGTSFVLGVVNNGLIQADQATPLTVTSGSLSNMTNVGTLRSAAGSTLAVAGNLTNFDTASRTLTGGRFEVAGTMRLPVAGGIVNNAAQIILDGTGSNLYAGNSGTVSALAGFAFNASTGRFELRGGRDFATTGDFINAGAVEIGSGSLMFTASDGVYQQTAGSTLVEGSLSAAGGILLSGGMLGGNGSILGNIVNFGTLAPGSSPGTLNISGDYTQVAGSLQIEIGADAFDQLNVGGTAYLGGLLDVLLWENPAFQPAIGQTFDILTATAISGQFSSMLLPTLATGSAWDIQYLVDAIGNTDVVRLGVVAAVPLPPTAWMLLTALGTAAGWRARRVARLRPH